MSSSSHFSNKNKIYHKLEFRISFIIISRNLRYTCTLPPKDNKHF